VLQSPSPFPLGQKAPANVPMVTRQSAATTAAAMDETEALSFLVKSFEEWAYTTAEERQLSARDRDYYDHLQLTETVRKALAKRGQPDIVINKISTKIDYLKGSERRLRSDPKAFPRNPSDEADSDAATQVLRYVADDVSYDQVRSAVWDNMVIEGIGGCDNPCEKAKDGSIEQRCHHIPYYRLWWDPHSMRPNFDDAGYFGSMVWMDQDEAEFKFKDAADAIGQTLTQEDAWGTFADTPRMMMWADTRRRRVLVVQGHYKRHGVWSVATFTRMGFLVKPLVSPYIDRNDNTTPSLRLRRWKIDRENHSYGAVRQYIGLQDEVNHRRSKALFQFSARQVKATEGVVDDVDAARMELAKPDGYIKLNPIPGAVFEVMQTGDMSAGQLDLLRHATDEFQLAGPNASLQGKDPREQSGRAVQLQQQGGAVENEPTIDALRQFNRENYQLWWMNAKQFWTDEKTIAITDDESNTDWVHLNHPVTLAEALSRLPDDKRAMAMQQMALQPGDPRLQQVVKVENNISDLDVRITVEDGPDLSTLQAEQFDFLQNRPDVPLEILIKYSSLPKKQDMLKDLKEIQAQQAQQQAATQAHALAMEQAKITLLNAQAAQANASASEKNAGAASRVHDIALDHAYITAPDNAPPGHEMALANAVGSSVPVSPIQPMPQVQQSANALQPLDPSQMPMGAPQPAPTTP
jgi:hypothetical protein